MTSDHIAIEPTVKKTIRHLPPINQFCVDGLFSLFMSQVLFCGPWWHWCHKWKTADMQRRKPFPHLPPIHQVCVHTVFSLLMLQVMFCAPWEQWLQNWRTAGVQGRKPFPLLSPIHQLIVQYNKYFLIVGNLILTSNQMDVINRTFCIKLPELFSALLSPIFQI